MLKSDIYVESPLKHADNRNEIKNTCNTHLFFKQNLPLRKKSSEELFYNNFCGISQINFTA